MKKYIISVLVSLNFILLNFCFAQVKDSLIQLTPEVGDTLDLFERDYYNLYPNIRNFKYAAIYLRNDSIAVSRINYLEADGNLEDTIITNKAFYIGNLRASVRQIDAERLEDIESLTEITLTTLDGNKIIGKLLSAQDSGILLCPGPFTTTDTISILGNSMKIPIQKIESVYIEYDDKTRVNDEATYGAIIGIIPGVIMAVNSVDGGFYSMSEDAVKVWAGIAGAGYGALIGGVIGMVVGLIISPADETIEINSASDLERLKEYVVQ